MSEKYVLEYKNGGIVKIKYFDYNYGANNNATWVPRNIKMKHWMSCAQATWM